jgi:signal transduction histidine kinase
MGVLLIPLILKSVFRDYSAGWWSAELMGLFALLMMPAVVGLLYVEALSNARTSERIANLYSDLMMHDISNMHQAALISLSLCEMDGIPDPSRDMALDDARRSLTRAVEIVADVRSISSARAGHGEHLGPVDLIQAIGTAHQHMQLQVSAERVDFEMSVPDTDCMVVADELLPSLFYNLMINAAKYSPEVPVIRVGICLEQLRGRPCWVTRIIDHGRGIEPARKTKLFERFMDGADGTGLGLAVAHALTQSYSGEISVDDRVKGDYMKGTVFTVTLPAYFENAP